ncbi:MAG TPA: alkaline phosphatase family protein [Anaerolineales bacterium]|nr:alkaline phosphatase family protein [Anaerolineales bacterium]
MLKTIIVGFDAFDPTQFERMQEAGQLPNLTKLVQKDSYRRFAVANPPQSEVSWTSIATGLNPGGHGIFDFVHRNPGSYTPSVSLLPTKTTSGIGTQFVPPHTAYTLFEQAADDGYPATVMWWPATFPARLEVPVRSFPGLGAPDIQGRLGVGTYFSVDSSWNDGTRKSQFASLTQKGNGRFAGALPGPVKKTRSGTEPIPLEIQLEMTGDASARLTLDKQRVELRVGEWSPILEITFNAGYFVKVWAITRFILTQAGSEPKLYALPLQIHPLHSPWRYATPPGFVKDTWKAAGPFLTLGWPQDTTALEEGCITDEQFLTLCNSIFETRERVFMHQLRNFQEGVLGTVFDTLDRVQHMYWHDRPDVIEEWYTKLDAFAGRVQAQLEKKGHQDARLIFVSDHGFTQFDQKVHLNRWLADEGYLTPNGEGTGLREIDWSKSQAYALGLNSVYLNMAGREGKGVVHSGEKDALLEKIRTALLAWRSPEGHTIVQSVRTNAEAFDGPLAPYGPDFVIGYAPGYRASQETGLGSWGANTLERNLDHWRADHCIAPEAVPGVVFANRGLSDFSAPSYLDFPALALGKPLKSKASAPPPISSDEDDKTVEERLKGLGYI